MFEVTMKPHKIGVVIVSYNSGAELESCLQAVWAQSSNQLIVLPVVVDNHSSDDSIAVAQKLKAIVVKSNKNLGYAKAFNLGVKKAYEHGCDMILMLNPDAILQPNCANAMLATLNDHDDVGAVGPSMLNIDGSPANTDYYLRAPGFLNVLFFSTVLRPWAQKRKSLVRLYSEHGLDHERTVEQIPGACLLARKTDLDTIGLLDEDFVIWFEDVEWSYRARKMGYRLVFCPKAKVVHEGGASFVKWKSIEKSITFFVSMKVFFKKHKLLLLPFVVAILVSNALVLFIKNRNRDQLHFIKQLLTQKRGQLPTE